MLLLYFSIELVYIVVHMSRPIDRMTIGSAQPLVNVALHKPCRQIDVRDGGVASRAVDGVSDGIWGHGSCCLTGAHEEPWWMVDLLDVHAIVKVIVTSRTDRQGG